LGIIYETKLGIELAVRLVDIESSEIMATADVYSKSKDRSRLKSMAVRLSEKFHRDFPMMHGSIIQIREDKITIIPEKWATAREKMRKGWPLIVYRKKKPTDKIRGSDTEIICDASIDELLKEELVAIPESDQQSEIRLWDNVINQ